MYGLVSECWQACNASSDDKSMNVVSALVGVDSLEVHDVSDHVVLVTNSISAQHVATLPSNGQSLAAVVTLEDADHLWHQQTLLLESTQLKAGLESKTDLCHGVS